ncbi:MAG: extracellular solute-binding protein [Planctomycetota bacterium]
MRQLLCVSLAFAVCCSACEHRDDGATLVVYSSVDDYVLNEVVQAFEDETGIDVLIVGDTEATKTTGLVQRLIAERAAPRADVWWSSEPFGTMRLAREGVLEEIDPPIEQWPAAHLDPEGRWVALALRARVVVYAPDRVDEADLPRDLRAYAESDWPARFGIADPRFGTTRGHIAALASAWGLEAMGEWLARMEEGGMRIYDGNASVVRAVALGEIDAGLTDTDDVFAAREAGLDVGMWIPSMSDQPSGEAWRGVSLVLPNTAGVIAGCTHPELANRFVSFLVGGRAESVMAASASRNWPVGIGVTPPEGWVCPPLLGMPMLSDISLIEGDAARIADAVLVN